MTEYRLLVVDDEVDGGGDRGVPGSVTSPSDDCVRTVGQAHCVDGVFISLDNRVVGSGSPETGTAESICHVETPDRGFGVGGQDPNR